MSDSGPSARVQDAPCRARCRSPPSGFSPSPRDDNTMGCSQSIIDKAKSYVVKAETTVDDLPDILQKLMSAKQNDASKAAAHADGGGGLGDRRDRGESVR